MSETAKVADFFALTFLGPVSVGRRSPAGHEARTVALAFFFAASFLAAASASAFFFWAAVGGVAFSVLVAWPGFGVTRLPSVGVAFALGVAAAVLAVLAGVVGVAPAAPGVGDAEGSGLAVPSGVGLADGVTGGSVGATTDGGAGSACTAEPALMALPTRAMTMPIATMAATITANRRTQYRSRGSGPTGCRTLLITGRLSSAAVPSGQARRAGANITNGYVRAVPDRARVPGRRDDQDTYVDPRRSENGAALESAPRPDGAGSERAVTVARVVDWYDQNKRDLPWRQPGTSPWAVLVSEFMLQQTPVERVREPWARWLERWPIAADLAASPSGDAVRAWGRLGYPRRALRLHGAAVAITERFGGEVPADLDDLRSLPGVGGYTAAAVASFAYGRRAVVLDTNVRRVLGRLAAGEPHPGAAQTRAEVAVAETFLPEEPSLAARWAVAAMELGAVVCTARAPRCDACPVTDVCAWRREGYPAWAGPPRRGQTYEGTDRQCRGALLAVLRSSDEPVGLEELTTAWPEPVQRERALASLVTDGLVVRTGSDEEPRWSLPG